MSEHTHEHTPGHESEQVAPGSGHAHSHGPHSHAQTKNVLNRLSRAIGHLNAVKRMVEDERDCSDILIQLAAVQSALNATSRIILKDHIEHCIIDAVESNDSESIEQLSRAIDQLLK